MSETTATVTIRHGKSMYGENRFEVFGPTGELIYNLGELALVGFGLPIPPAPIPDPPEGCNRVIDCAGDQWTRMLCNPNVWEFGISKRGWAQLVKVYGPVTPLIPGDPIEAP